MNFTIETKNLILKVLDENSALQVLQFYNRNRLFFEPYEPERPSSFYTIDYQEVSLRFEFQEILKGKSIRYWMFVKEDPEKIIGSVNLQNILKGAFQSAILGYKLDYLKTKNGYMTEALDTFLTHAFKDMGLHRIEALVHPNNKPSIALLERLNFTMEGTAKQCIKLNDLWQDHFRYTLIN